MSGAAAEPRSLSLPLRPRKQKHSFSFKLSQFAGPKHAKMPVFTLTLSSCLHRFSTQTPDDPRPGHRQRPSPGFAARICCMHVSRQTRFRLLRFIRVRHSKGGYSFESMTEYYVDIFRGGGPLGRLFVVWVVSSFLQPVLFLLAASAQPKPDQKAGMARRDLASSRASRRRARTLAVSTTPPGMPQDVRKYVFHDPMPLPPARVNEILQCFAHVGIDFLLHLSRVDTGRPLLCMCLCSAVLDLNPRSDLVVQVS